jgi:hypothetical protein
VEELAPNVACRAALADSSLDIANAGRATVSLDLLRLNFENLIKRKEERLHVIRRLGHSASFLNALPCCLFACS